MVRKKRVKRGYPVAFLVGINKENAVIWKIFSRIIKLEKVISFKEFKKDQRSNYNVYEVIIDTLRPAIKDGVKSIILATLPRTIYATEFISHIKKHHSWLSQGLNKISISRITGLTNTKEEVKSLIRNKLLQKIISKTTEKETEDLMNILDRNIASNNSKKEILYSFEKIQKNIIQTKKSSFKPEYLILTNKYLANFKNKNQINRVLQIAKNKKVVTRVVSSKSHAGLRLTQLGGLVCLLKHV